MAFLRRMCISVMSMGKIGHTIILTSWFCHRNMAHKNGKLFCQNKNLKKKVLWICHMELYDNNKILL